MQHCLLTESIPQWSLIDSYHQVGPNVELTNSWAGEVSVGISLMVAYWQGWAMHCPIAGQDLLLSNRMWSNTAKQWLPANGCAHAALFHKDTLGTMCFNLIDWLLSHLRFWFHMLVYLLYIILFIEFPGMTVSSAYLYDPPTAATWLHVPHIL